MILRDTSSRLDMHEPYFSVIVPVRDDAASLERTLSALRASTFGDWELLVVDDGSRDGSSHVARRHGDRVLRTSERGAAAARNLGATAARGRYLLFLDADCEPHPETLERMAAALEADPEVDGVFGSYDDSPACPGFASQYKNLFHHYIHQRARESAVTFWTGCGAVRRTTFERLGGFDPEQRMLEDVELGLRLARAGARVRLAKSVQVRHLKRWTLGSMIRSDVLDRALPWARLVADGDGWIDDLNLCRRDRCSAVLALGLGSSLAVAMVQPAALVVAAVAAALLAFTNRDLYGFLRQRRGTRFALAAVPAHWAYFAYGSLGLALGLVLSTALRLARGAAHHAAPAPTACYADLDPTATSRLTEGRMRQTHRLAIVGLVLFAGLAFLPWVSLQGEEFRWQSFGTLYQSDLEIEKTSNPPVPLLVGDQLPYTLTVRNLGPNDATGVVVDDALAANTSYVSDTCGGVYSGGTNSWSWTIGPLAANAQTACGLTVLVTGTGTLTNTAMVSGDQNDPTLANDSSTAVDRSVGANVPGLTPAGLAALVALLAAVSVVLLRRPR